MGLFLSMLDEARPPKSKFNVEDIPDLTGKVVIVTGANTGVEWRQRRLSSVTMLRSIWLLEAKRSVGILSDDLRLKREERESSSAGFGRSEISQGFGQEFLSKETDLHVLFNNAGVMIPPLNMVTTQNYDLQFGTNVLGHFYFTKLLMPSLLAGAKSSADGHARVVNTSSASSLMTKKINFDTLTDGPARRKKSPTDLYNQSKLGNVFFSNEMARRYANDGIISTSLAPGFLRSDLQRHFPTYQKPILILLHPLPLGALTQLWAGTSAEGLDLNGQYLKPWARLSKHPSEGNVELAKKMWDWCEKQVEHI